MILTCASPSPALRDRRNGPLFEGFRTDYIATPGAQAFLVEQDPHFHLSAHYHLQHQFQVVVDGGGTLGKHVIKPFALHYASAESGYGPIIAGAEGLSYFTLRVIADSTTWVLPEHRGRMRQGLPKRQRFVDALSVPEDQPPSPDIDAVMPMDAHGTGAWLVRVPAGESVVVPGAQQGAGRFHIVGSGNMLVDGQRHGPKSVVYASSEEAEFRIVAGDAPLQVVVVQFPRDALV